ncbi:MAG: DNA repair protein RadC [Saprospiraceae bacterium]|nr:DNA repair protein RadC [Bacteroidia bacterium]MBT8230830.1 DNA repair protein RadC [Bacteroidia bacterium]NNF20322.1 DNA repair protein RadC [Saprospiraceae bacterium]NNK89277.1 DNA repair protein RadC [Saprospiraceae bacterium]
MNNNQPFSIKYWAEEDRPREKLLLKGRQNLSNAELIAILIGSGTKELSAVQLSKNILIRFDNDLNELARLQVADLKKFKGIGEAKAVSVIAALELGRRRQISTSSVKSRITSSKDAYKLLAGDLRDLNHEVFKILLLNRNNRVLRTETISIGGIAGTVVDPKIIFKKALDHHASSIILCHNHPSGNLNPSRQDIEITKKIVEAGKVIEIQILDHLIISYEGYFSFADEALI